MTILRQHTKARSGTAALFVLLTVLTAAGCGDDDDGDNDAGAASDGEQSSSYCDDLERMMVAGVELNEALFNRDAAALQTAIDEYHASSRLMVRICRVPLSWIAVSHAAVAEGAVDGDRRGGPQQAVGPRPPRGGRERTNGTAKGPLAGMLPELG